MRYNLPMRILGIETSCDETAVCLIETQGSFGPGFSFSILGNTLYSQAALHAEYGGVFPNLAKREHARNLVPLLQSMLKDAGELEAADMIYHIDFETLLEREPELLQQLPPFLERHKKPAIDCIAVTHGPGLEPALWVGINFARALATAWDIPLVAVNHMEGHIVLSMMAGSGLTHFEFPVLSLLISGGHTELVLSETFGSYNIIGQTRDDAAGEAFDKVARLLGLGYPGGPEISRLASQARNERLTKSFILPRPMIHEDTLDFSFSGLKTAVRKIVEQGALTETTKQQLAREFEDAVADVLVGKTIRALEEYGAQTVLVSGGVSANTHIRLCLGEALAKTGGGTRLLAPPPEFATDNALMIALAGYFHALEGDSTDPSALVARGNLKLA